MGFAKQIMEEHDASVARGYSIPEKGEKYLCSAHYSNEFLRDFILKHGREGTCSFCDNKGIVVDFSEFVSYVGGRLADYLEDIDDAGLPLANSFYDDDEEEIPGLVRRGVYIAPEDAEYYESNREAMIEFGLLSDLDTLDKDISSHLYLGGKIRRDPTSFLLSEELSYLWDRFCTLVKTSQRYTFFKSSLFDKTPIEFNEHGLFDILSELGGLVHLVEGILPADTTLYRCRPAKEGEIVDGFKDCTSPPVSKARANRLSPSGISMFYGSFDRETPVKETKNYTKDPIIYLGSFRTKRQLTVVNLCKIPEADFWMPNGWQEYSFLNQFHKEISKPLGPDDVAEIEYVPSQIFTEYLRFLCKSTKGVNYDGIVYRSSLTKKENVVLFYDSEASSSILELLGAPRFITV